MIGAEQFTGTDGVTRAVDRDAANRQFWYAQRRFEREDVSWKNYVSAEERRRRREEMGFYESRDEKPRLELPPCDAEIQVVSAAGLHDGDYVQEMLEISAEDRAFAFSAHGEYLAHCMERTGATLPDEELRKKSREAATLLRQSEQIAEKMKAAGFECYRETPFELERYFLHSREREKLPSFRRTCFIPYVAQAIRAPILTALEFFIERNEYCRFWTFSSGVRVRLSGIRDRARELHDRIKDLNAQPFMKAAGVRIVFRATELGTPETDAQGNTLDGGEIERDDDGQLYFHVHAHCVVEMRHGMIRGMSKRFNRHGKRMTNWEAFLARVGDYWRDWWHDGSEHTPGPIRNAREVCKYVTKPGEMLKLSGPELVELQQQLYRLKLVQPMGSLAEEIRAREEAGQRLVRKKTPDGRVYVAVKNWNRHTRRTALEKAADAAAKLTPSNARGYVKVVSRGAPRFGKAGVAEPCVTIMYKRGSWNEDAVRLHKLVAPIIAATAEKFALGVAARAMPEEAAPIRVHTRTLTVPAKPRGKPRTTALWPSEVGCFS